MGLVDEPARLLVVIGQRNALALHILLGLVRAGAVVSGERDRARPRLDLLVTLEDLAGQPEAMRLVHVLMDLGEEAVLIEIGRVRLGTGRADRRIRAAVIGLVPLPEATLQQHPGIVEPTGDRAAAEDGLVGRVEPGLCETADRLAGTDQVFRIEGAHGQRAAERA